MKKLILVDVPEGSNIQSVIIEIPMGVAPFKDFTEITPPTDEEIKYTGTGVDPVYIAGYNDGAKWMRDQINENED